MHVPKPWVVVALIAATIAASVLLSALIIDADAPPSELPQGVELIYKSFIVPARGSARGDATCPVGTVVTGGGTYANAVKATLLVLDSQPVQDGARSVWRARFSNKSTKEVSVGSVAVCAAAASPSNRRGSPRRRSPRSDDPRRRTTTSELPPAQPRVRRRTP